jgi:hypothetical protein
MQFFPREGDKLSGGLSNVILADEFFQLPAMNQRPLFYNKPVEATKEVLSMMLYREFKPAIDLGVIRRQAQISQCKQALDQVRLED